MAAAVSIVVPVYNAEKYLPRCMASLLAQTLSDLQIILVDDGSRDSSGRLCDAYAVQDARVTVIHQTNRGAGFARNAGLDAAAGEYVGFVDADDEIEPAMFERLYEAAKKHDADMALSGMKQISAADETDVREVGGFEREQRFVSEEEREQLLLGVAGALPH
ncbi:MAG: glycosyltransferase, partial [Clostridia bacterium]|nr:glycosyltransferase [Clostridia bacterium]